MKNIIKNCKKLSAIFAIAFVFSFGFQTAHAETFTQNLTTGSTGDQVVSLQTWLESNGFLVMPEGTPKGYFGMRTQSALVAYQKSVGLPAFGYFGPMTRGYLNNDGGNASALKIILPNGGENWKIGDYQTIKWNAPNYFRATTVDITVTRVYECKTLVCPMIAFAPSTIVKKVSVDQHVYIWKVGDVQQFIPPAPDGIYPIPSSPLLQEGQYNIQICETGTSSCDSSDKAFTISTASTSTQNSIKVISPYGGEKWEINSTHQIKWDDIYTSSTTRKVDLYLVKSVMCIAIYPKPSSCNPALIVLDKNIATNSMYNWIAGTDISNNVIQPGDYKVKVCVAGTEDCDFSNQIFSLVANTTLLRVCPSDKIVNKMPTIMPNDDSSSTYYILNGQRREISEFDLDWVTRNCSVKEQTVY